MTLYSSTDPKVHEPTVAPDVPMAPTHALFAFARQYLRRHPADSGRIIEHMPIDQAIPLVIELVDDAKTLTELMSTLLPTTAAQIIAELDEKQMRHVLENLSLDQSIAITRQLSVETRRNLFDTLDDRVAQRMRDLLNYEHGSAGSIMDPGVLAMPKATTARQCLRKFQSTRLNALYYIYVTDHNRLCGVISIKELLPFSDSDKALADLMHAPVTSVPVHLRDQALLVHPGWQQHSALPVVDEHEHFLGAIRYESIRQLERQVRQQSSELDLKSTGQALGELYFLGIAGLIHGATASLEKKEP